MTATNERTGTPRIAAARAAARPRLRTARRHEDAVIQAEVRRLARALNRLPAGIHACREPAPRLSGDGSI